MALRVLLADESTTIKKVMQLALQDFAVEVKAVHAGIDVLEVSRAFQPDIIFADVLLQKKNGYEVAAIVKNDRELRSVPVVLMWSSFMDLDDAQARSSGAEARLEKPFDVETLRKLVLELVPKTRSQRLAHFLEFSPKLNEELQSEAASRPSIEKSQASAPPPAAAAPAARAQATPPPPPAARKVATPPPAASFNRQNTNVSAPRATPPPPPSAKADKSTWSMESFDDPSKFESPLEAEQLVDHGTEHVADHDADLEAESFQPLELSQLSTDGSRDGAPAGFKLDTHEESAADDEAWARQDLSQFKLDLPPISVGEGGDEFKIDMGEDEFSSATFETEPAPLGNDLTLDAHAIGEAEHEIALPLEPLDIEESIEMPKNQNRSSSAKPPPGAGQMSAERLESIIRAQSREIIEQVVRKLVPDLAATIIREELERLLTDAATDAPLESNSARASTSGSPKPRKDSRL